MIDLGRIVGFEWDAGNLHKSLSKHGVDRTEAEQAFLDERLMISDDVGHSKAEVRYQALGTTFGRRRLHVTFTLRADGTLIRVISARDMSRKERAQYESQA